MVKKSFLRLGFITDKNRRKVSHKTLLSKNQEVLKNFQNVTLLRLTKIETVFLQFGRWWKINLSNCVFLTSLYLYEVMGKVAVSLPETNNWGKNFKLSLSHCDKASFYEWYKITVLGITFFVFECIKNPKYVLESMSNLWHLEA